MNASIALQILTLNNADSKTALLAVDKVIEYLKSTNMKVLVCPFETVIEGDYEQLMIVLKKAIEIASEYHYDIFANVKIHYNSKTDILSIDEKITKHR